MSKATTRRNLRARKLPAPREPIRPPGLAQKVAAELSLVRLPITLDKLPRVIRESMP